MHHIVAPVKGSNIIHQNISWYTKVVHRQSKQLRKDSNIHSYTLQHYSYIEGETCSMKEKVKCSTSHTHFFASSFFGIFSIGVDFSIKSLAARSCRVPPHFNPRACSSDFNLSRPRTYHNKDQNDVKCLFMILSESHVNNISTEEMMTKAIRRVYKK